MTSVAEIAILNAWHPSLETGLWAISAFNNGLGVVGAAVVKITASPTINSGSQARKRECVSSEKWGLAQSWLLGTAFIAAVEEYPERTTIAGG